MEGGGGGWSQAATPRDIEFAASDSQLLSAAARSPLNSTLAGTALSFKIGLNISYETILIINGNIF